MFTGGAGKTRSNFIMMVYRVLLLSKAHMDLHEVGILT